MIIILFISLAIVYFLVQYFENKRREKIEKEHDRRQESFSNLLNVLREKEKSADNKNIENEN